MLSQKRVHSSISNFIQRCCECFIVPPFRVVKWGIEEGRALTIQFNKLFQLADMVLVHLRSESQNEDGWRSCKFCVASHGIHTPIHIFN